ncbi:MAG: hypothetical protein HY369_03780 [Candidatus Aenigmarchaeota archaeon]|nr:hypothetical protein [Candidatus Aenigmarchaeota archaeon]
MKGLILVLGMLVFAVLGSGSAAAQSCSIDVFGLDVEGNEISVTVHNTGETEQNVSYTFIVDDDELANGSIVLGADDEKEVANSFSFSVGTFDIEFTAKAGCGATDHEEITHTVLQDYSCSFPAGVTGENYCSYATQSYQVCQGGSWVTLAQNSGSYCNSCGVQVCGDGVCNCFEDAGSCWQDCKAACTPGFVDQFQCSGSTLQQAYKNADCSTSYVSTTSCPLGCQSGACIGASSSGSCVAITSLDFVDHLVAGNAATVTATIENTKQATVTTVSQLTIDTFLKGTSSLTLLPFEKKQVTFTITPAAGGHTGKVALTSSCGTDSQQFNFLVTPSLDPVLFQDPVLPLEPFSTSVTILPPSMDIPLYQAKAIGIEIVSAVAQDFSVQVSGLPAEFLSYDDLVPVETSRTTFVFVTPTAAGTYEAQVTVTAGEEGLTFTETIPIFVATASLSPAALAIPWYEILLVAGLTVIICAVVIGYHVYYRKRHQRHLLPR